jgi:glycosyltransferase involved in cell wall biosynthesis
VQVVANLRDTPSGNAAVDIALTLLQSGARAIVAGDNGPLVDELLTFGGEFVRMPNDTLNPIRIRRNASTLAKMIGSERVDIVHAQSAGATWSALSATHQQPVYLVTSFPDRPPGHSWLGNMLRSSLARGDHAIAPSAYVSRAMIERYKLAPDRITVIPRAVDTARFSPAAVSADRIAQLRRVWGVLPNMRVVLVPGRIAPWNGQLSVVDAAQLIVGGGERNVVFVFAGDDRAEQRYARSLRRQAQFLGIDTLCRFVGPRADTPAAMAAAAVLAVPSLEPPLSGRVAAEAQAMGRPLVTPPWACCRRTCCAPRACPTNCAPAGWCGQAMSASSRAQSALRLRSTLPPTRR